MGARLQQELRAAVVWGHTMGVDGESEVRGDTGGAMMDCCYATCEQLKRTWTVITVSTFTELMNTATINRDCIVVVIFVVWLSCRHFRHRIVDVHTYIYTVGRSQ